MGKIVQLDEHLINLISAGEVVERASNVVKELIENSIDAGSKSISISLIESGLKEIIVKDDGCGMDRQDAKMCFLPHCTSKIKQEEDLFRIRTLGFRGEALPSICAVSNFSLKTSTEGGRGVMFSLKGGQLVTEATISCTKGTEIAVRNLFFNTPARLQNVQSPQVELSYIVDFVQKEALCRPDISFKLSNNDKVIFQTYGTNDQLEVLGNIYGNDLVKEFRNIFSNNGYYKISGYISKLGLTRSNRNHMHIIINGRPIKNNSVIRSILDGYHTYLMTGRYPICLININTDPSLVDVNCHPAKLEVRFYDEQNLLKMISETIKTSLQNTKMLHSNQINDIDEETYIDYESELNELDNVLNEFNELDSNIDNVPLDDYEVFSEEKVDEKVDEPTYDESNYDILTYEDNVEPSAYDDKVDEPDYDENVDESTSEDSTYEDSTYDESTSDKLNEEELSYERKIEDNRSNMSVEDAFSRLNKITSYYRPQDDFKYDDVKEKEIQEHYSSLFKEKSIEELKKPVVEEVVSPVKEEPKYTSQQFDFTPSYQKTNKLLNVEFIGQLFGTYIICQDDNYFYLIDQHAANERINYEKIVREFKKQTNVGYELLIPIRLDYTVNEILLINQNMDKLNKLGYVIEEFGSNSLMVREVPIWLFKGKEKEFTEEIIDAIVNNSKSERFEFLDNLAKSLACKKSVKGNTFITKVEMEYLIEDLGKCDNPYTCPHGRPVIIKHSKTDVDKWFKRIV